MTTSFLIFISFINAGERLLHGRDYSMMPVNTRCSIDIVSALQFRLLSPFGATLSLQSCQFNLCVHVNCLLILFILLAYRLLFMVHGIPIE